MNKILWALSFLSMFFIVSFGTAADLIQKNDKGQFQAQLQNVRLIEITKFIQEKHGIQFKGDESLFQTPITVSFANLELEEMLKKILVRKNSIFAYNSKGEVTEVRLLPGGNDAGLAKTATSRPPLSSTPNGNQASSLKQSGTASFPNAAEGAAARQTKEAVDMPQTPDEITSFEVDPNAPPDDVTSFKVDPDAKDEITSFKVIENAPPPGGEVKEGTAENPDEITSFKVFRSETSKETAP